MLISPLFACLCLAGALWDQVWGSACRWVCAVLQWNYRIACFQGKNDATIPGALNCTCSLRFLSAPMINVFKVNTETQLHAALGIFHLSLCTDNGELDRKWDKKWRCTVWHLTKTLKRHHTSKWDLALAGKCKEKSRKNKTAFGENGLNLDTAQCSPSVYGLN